MICVVLKGSSRFATWDTEPVWAGIRTRYVYRCFVCWCPCDSPYAASCVSHPWNLAKRGVAEAASAFNAGVGSGNPHHLATVTDIGQPPLSHRTAGETRQIGFASPRRRPHNQQAQYHDRLHGQGDAASWEAECSARGRPRGGATLGIKA